LSWIKGSGIEAGGCKYQSSKGIVNSGPISTFLQYAVISESRLVRISKELPLREAALLGCALPTGAGVVFNQLHLTKGSSFAVFGAGGVGLSAILAAKFLEADPIIALDISDEKLAQAKSFGATHLINCSNTKPIEAIHTITGGKGCQGTLECVGNSEVMETAFRITASRGICIIAGNLPKGQTIQIDPFDLILGKQIFGTWGGNSDIENDVAKYSEMLTKKSFSVSRLITHEGPLEKINDLLSFLENRQAGRVMVTYK
jgi:S-(hydroxymethyl)glutathione dehydrogenase / alcohol dehydrogenase